MTYPDPPRVSVVIPTYNRCELLRKSLRQLTRQRIAASDFEVIVSDDGSSDDTKAVVDSFADRLRMKYHYQEDLGFRAGEARNAGARLASAPILVFMDTGQMAGPDYLKHYLAAHADGVSRALLGYAHGYNPVQPMAGVSEALDRMPPEEVLAHFKDEPAFFDVRHEELAKSDFDLSRRALPWFLFWTLNCSLRADDFWAVGGFDEEFRGWGVEDLELGYRLYRHGVTLQVSRDAWVIDSPHDRDWPSNLRELAVNLLRMVGKYPEPVMEIGWALSTKGELLPWEEDYAALTAWGRKIRDLDVRDEIEEAARHVERGGRIAVLGAGGAVPESLPASVLLDFDQQLLERALSAGRHAGHHTMGLRTPLADQSVDTVIITSRMAGLWDRWNDMLLAEARRIGRTVYTMP